MIIKDQHNFMKHLRLFIPVLMILALGAVNMTVATAQTGTITIGFSEPSSTVLESVETAVEVFVTIEGGTVVGDFSVDLTVVDGGTTAGEDYVTPQSTYEIACPVPPLNIPCDPRTVTENALELIDDMVSEDTETVTFTISNPQGEGLQLGANTTHVLTITDDDEPDPSLPGLTRIYPADEAVLDGGPEWPRFSFAPVTDATWYGLWIGPGQVNNYATVNLFQWYEGSQICEGEVCTVPTDVYTLDGTYEWWMTYYIPGDTEADYTDRWGDTSFEVAFGDIPALDRTDPATTLPGSLQWAYDDAALWYQVWVGLSDYSTFVIFDWYSAEELTCGGGTCTLDTSEVTFEQGDYQWWMEAWGPGEYDVWTVNNNVDFSQVNALRD